MHQLENGYTRIANTLLEYFSRLPLSGAGLRIIFWVIRNSYGYNRKETQPVSVRGIGKDVCLDVGATHRALMVLFDNKILGKKSNGALFINKKELICVAKTERLKALPKLNTPLPKLNESVAKTEHPLLKEERKKDNLKDSRFHPPTMQELTTHIQSIGSKVDPNRFIAYYESKGWKVGNSPMKNWKAAIRTWDLKNKPVKPELTREQREIEFYKAKGVIK